MQKQKFDEIISYVNKKVSEMEIETKYKMELLGMVTALGYAHEKETHDKRTETHARDCISRQAAFDAINTWDKFGVDERSRIIRWHEGLEPYVHLRDVLTAIVNLPSAQPVIHCWECIYYDPEHIEKKGVRYEYEDMPKDAFDILGTGLVNSEYGINVGGRCCRDYNVGYSEDKRVFVSKQNYCGRAERRTDG